MRRHALLVSMVMLLGLGGCDRLTHDMEDQPRYNPAKSSPFFADGQAERPPVPGAVAHARGDRAAVSSGRDALLETAAVTTSTLAAQVDHAALIARGQQRYTIYCLPCHGATGQGDGEVVKRGFPAPRSLLDAAVSRSSNARLDDVIAHGIGTMYPFYDRLDAADRQAVVAYLRVLQTSVPVAATAVDLGTTSTAKVPR